MGGVLERLQKDDLLLANLTDETLPVALRVALVESITMGALCVAVVLGESRCHMLAVDVVSAVGFRNREEAVARNAPEEMPLILLRVASADEEREGSIGLLESG